MERVTFSTRTISKVNRGSENPSGYGERGGKNMDNYLMNADKGAYLHSMTMISFYIRHHHQLTNVTPSS